MKKKKTAAIAVLMVLVGVSITLWLTVGRKLFALFRQPETLRAWVEGCGPWAPLCMVGLMCFQVIVAVLPGEAMEIGAGTAFGAWRGLALCVAGAAIGSAIVFAVTKKWGVKLVETFIPREKLAQLSFLRNNRRLYELVFLLFFIPGSPKDVLTYFAGLTEMKLWPFVLLTSVARVPSILTSTLGGAALGSGKLGAATWILIATLVVSVLGVVVYGRLIKKEQAVKKLEDEAKAKQKSL